MKFNPTLPLAVALSVGVAGAVMAQTATSQTPTANPSTGYSQPSTTAGQPQADAGQTQTGYGQMPSSTGQTQASTLQQPSATGRTQPTSGQMPSATAWTQPRQTTAAPSTASGTAPGGNEQVRMAQERLRAAGLYNGPQDGIMDPDTRAAIARYQEQRGLRRTESLDPATLSSLQGSQTTSYGSTTPPATSTNSRTPSAASNPYAGATGANAGKSFGR